MSLQQGLQIVGMAAGFAIGGPLGASIGGMAGGMAGAALTDPVKIEGPRLTDLRVMSSSYGAAIPLIYGAQNRVSGNLIWSTGLIERSETEESGGKGGGGAETTTYHYSTSVAISLGEGPCTAVRRIWANGKLLWSSDGEAPNLGYVAFYPGDWTQTPDPRIEANLGVGNAPAYSGICYVVLGDLQLADYGNALPNLEFELDGLVPRTLADILRDLCVRSGMRPDEYYVPYDLEGIAVDGYTIASPTTTLAAIAPLEAAYAFDTVEQHGITRFVRRGRMPLTTIDPGDLAARAPDASETPPRYSLDRQPDHELARSVALTYRSPARDYQEATQTSTRTRGEAFTDRTDNLALVLSDAAAKAVADRTLWASWTDRMPARITVSDRYRFLVPGDSVMIEMTGAHMPFRIEHLTRGADGLIELELRQEDPFIYRGSTEAAVAPVPAQSIEPVGSTFVYAFNAPMTTAAGDDMGFAWAIDAASSGWRGGSVYRSLDEGDSWSRLVSESRRDITGSVATALPGAACELWDRTNSVDVVLRYANHELESKTELQVLNGANAAWIGAANGSHGEIVQFATVELIAAAPKTYRLSNLLRGRRGTEHEAALHGPDEVFVLLNITTLRSADFGQSEWQRSRLYRGVSVYEDPDTVTDHQHFTASGERKRPRSPVHARAQRDDAGNLSLSWVRRVRGYPPVLGYGAVPLDESTEAYEIDVVVGGTVKRTLSASTPSVTYTAAQQAADGITPGAPVTVCIYQLSALAGRGHPGGFTL